MLIVHGNRKENKIALTFDDGPNPYGTPKVLKILDKFKINATFFLIGGWVKKYPNLVKEIKKRGHLIGNHSYSHMRFNRDANLSAKEILKITGEYPIYLRPPYFNLLPYLPEFFSRKIKLVLGDVVPFDWKSTAIEIFDNAIRQVENGSIIVLHDGSHREYQKERCKEMIKVLPRLIKALKRNYDLVRLDQLKY